MGRYRVDSLAELARQLTFAPGQVRCEQLEAAGVFVSRIDPAKTYSYPDVVEQVTTFRPRHHSEQLIPGRALLHDLSILIEEVSDTLNLRVDEISQPVLAIEDVTERFNVTSKTIQRWRKRGLVSHRFIFGDGRKRIGFYLQNLERFVRANGEDVEERANLSAMGESEQHEIVRAAKVLLVRASKRGAPISEQALAFRLAQRFNRSVLAITHTLRRHDTMNPTRAVLVAVGLPVGEESARKCARLARRGRSFRWIARKMNISQLDVYLSVMRERVARVTARKVKFHDSPLFHDGDIDAQIDEVVSASEHELQPAETPRIPRGLPPYLQDLYRTPLLTPARERAQFLLFNYRKLQWFAARRRFDPERARKRDVALLEHHCKRAGEIKNRLVSANLRLVVSVARKHLQPGLSLMELISEGNLVLMRAVESFNVHRNTRFSTYATFALIKAYARIVPTLRAANIGGHQPPLERIADRHGSEAFDAIQAREEISKLLSQLSDAERNVIAQQFGLRNVIVAESTVGSTSDGTSNLTAQRRRRIEHAAIVRLRQIVGIAR